MNSIKAIRERLSVTQEAMGAGIGVTQGNISNYEHGQRVSPAVAKRLIEYAKSLGHKVTYDDIYGGPKPLSRRKSDKAPKPTPS